MAIRHAWSRAVEDVPTVEHFRQLRYSLRVHQHSAGSKRHECRVYMHRMVVVEFEFVDSESIAEMPPQPLYAEAVGDMALLNEDVFPAPNEIRGIECRLEFGDRVVDDLAVDRLFILVVIKLFRQLRLRAGAPSGSPSKVLFDDRAEGVRLEIPLPPSHGALDDFITDSQQPI